MLRDLKKEKEMPTEIIEKYKGQVPDEIIEIWKNYGLGSFLNGYLRVINPDDYKELVEETYFIKSVNNKKTTFEEAEAILESKYKSSLENKKQALGLRLDLVEIEKQIPYISKSLSISMLDGKFLLEVSDEEYEKYFYINPNAPIALTYYPNLIDDDLHKVPLSMFMEDKEFVREVIKDFFDKGNTEKVKENYIKNKWIMDKYK